MIYQALDAISALFLLFKKYTFVVYFELFLSITTQSNEDLIQRFNIQAFENLKKYL